MITHPRVRYIAFGVAVFASGACGDASRPMAPAATGTRAAFSMRATAMIPRHDRLSIQQRAQIQEIAARPSVAAMKARLLKLSDRGPLTSVIVDDSLSASVLGEIHLNESGPLSRYFVASARGLDDEVIDRITGLAFRYEIQHPKDMSPVTITLRRDGSYSGASHSLGHFSGVLQFGGRYTRRDIVTSELLAAIAKTPYSSVSGVGRARIVRLGQRK